MTAARRSGKSRPLRALIFVLAAAASLAGGVPGRAATTELVVADPHTGLAIAGFDPVAYFTDGAARPGLPEFEFGFAGAVWRFRNEGNRAAFMADPEVYMPRFGGHDPVAAARGAGTPGHPELWAVAEGRLYLFYSAAAREAFLRDPGLAIDAAERGWPAALKTLAP